MWHRGGFLWGLAVVDGDPLFRGFPADTVLELERAVVYPDGTRWSFDVLADTAEQGRALAAAYATGIADPFVGRSWHRIRVYVRRENGRFTRPAFGVRVEASRPPRGEAS
jgi:hypothetical protein